MPVPEEVIREFDESLEADIAEWAGEVAAHAKKYGNEMLKQDGQGWIGVDLDGTLAYYDPTAPYSPYIIGDPIPAMVDRVRGWLADGIPVKILTARVAPNAAEDVDAVRKVVQDWCNLHLGESLEVTCSVDPYMVELYNDRAVGVKLNTGELVGVRDSGYLCAELSDRLGDLVHQFARSIDVEDLAGEGVLKEHAIIICDGLIGDVAQELARSLLSTGPAWAQLGNLMMMPAKDGLLLCANVISPDLEELRGIIGPLQVVSTAQFSDALKHVPLAYVREESAEKYTGSWPFAGESIEIRTVTYVNRYGDRVDIPLTGGPTK